MLQWNMAIKSCPHCSAEIEEVHEQADNIEYRYSIESPKKGSAILSLRLTCGTCNKEFYNEIFFKPKQQTGWSDWQALMPTLQQDIRICLRCRGGRASEYHKNQTAETQEASIVYVTDVRQAGLP